MTKLDEPVVRELTALSVAVDSQSVWPVVEPARVERLTGSGQVWTGDTPCEVAVCLSAESRCTPSIAKLTPLMPTLSERVVRDRLSPAHGCRPHRSGRRRLSPPTARSSRSRATAADRTMTESFSRTARWPNHACSPTCRPTANRPMMKLDVGGAGGVIQAARAGVVPSVQSCEAVLK